ncbi:MAG: hypothetical protein GXO50_03105 [Chlorobi bacterium]|nr:hypothetical protein [Chlorobiota bacterium]
MKYKTTLILLILIGLFACKNEKPNKTGYKKNNTEESVNINPENFNPEKSAIKVADTIMYITNVKNPVPENAYYMDQWLGGAKIQLLADKIFDAVYAGKLKAYNYITGKEMTIQEVKELEKEFDRKNIGQILFTEDWYFDPENLKMYKQVNSLMLAYFRYDEDGNLLGNKAGIRVYFNGTKPMRGAQDY